MCLGVVAILVLNVMDVFSVGGGGGALLLVWSTCACCAYDPSVHLIVPSIGCIYVFVCRKVSPHLRV